VEHSSSDSGLDFPREYEVVPVLRSISVPASAFKALGEQEILAAVEALLHKDSLPAPLHRKIVDCIVQCDDAELISKLAAHANEEVRRVVALNKNLPEDLLWKLAEDDSYLVRASLADNQHLPAFLLEALAEDEDERIANHAMRTLDRQNATGAHVQTFSARVFQWMHFRFAS
jgi:hypothetical protein